MNLSIQQSLHIIQIFMQIIGMSDFLEGEMAHLFNSVAYNIRIPLIDEYEITCFGYDLCHAHSRLLEYSSESFFADLQGLLSFFTSDFSSF